MIRCLHLPGRLHWLLVEDPGLGKAIAHALSDAGASLILVGRRQSKLTEALGERSGDCVTLDLMNNNAPDELFDKCQSLGSMPDIVVNAAGINPRVPANDLTLEVWNSTIHLNLSVPFFLAQKFASHMMENNWGRIINIASLQSERAFLNGISYGASKGGVSQLTRAMAEAWSAHGINANAIAPGFFPTDLTAAVFDDPDRATQSAAQTAIGRNGELEDLAGPAVFLASDASRYVTGQILYVDGGYTAK